MPELGERAGLRHVDAQEAQDLAEKALMEVMRLCEDRIRELRARDAQFVERACRANRQVKMAE